MTQSQLERRVRYPTTYAVGSTVVVLVIGLTAFSPQRITEWKEVLANTAQIDTLRAGHI